MAKRKIPCNYCKGQVLATQNGRGTSSAPLFPRLQNFLSAITDLISILTGGQQTISRKQALGGKCKACGGSGQIEDPTDTSEQDKAAADFLLSKASAIEAAEKRLGHSPGGSLLERIAGAKVTIVGRTLNTAKSVTIHEGKARQPSAQVVNKAGPVTEGPDEKSATNIVTGNNPPANTGGGVYYIQCGNKFKMTTGAQGIEMASYGPISIDGTQVRISGAEVTIGGSKGPTLIEGDHLQINGKSVAITPSGSAGEVVIQGSASCSGNFKAGGAYVENMYCASLTMPSTQVSSKVSAGTTDYITSQALWTPSNGVLSVMNLVKWAMDSTMDLNFFFQMSPLNPRSIMKTIDNSLSIVWNAIPIEPRPTGICFTAVGPGIVFNFSHTHGMPDSPHSHETSVPAISHDGNSSADVVRQKFAGGGGNSKVPVGPTESGNIITKLIGGVMGVGRAFSALTSGFISPYYFK
jgi:hypothetical protein